MSDATKDRAEGVVDGVGARSSWLCTKKAITGIHPFRPSAARWPTFPIKGKEGEVGLEAS